MATNYTAGEGLADKMGTALVSRSDAFFSILETATASTAATVVAAPATTESHYITDIIVSTEAAMAFEFVGTLTSGSPALVTVKIPKQYSAANSVQKYHFSQPVKFGEGEGIAIRTYSAGNITVAVGGYTI